MGSKSILGSISAEVEAEVEFDPGLARSTLEFDPLEAENSALRAKFERQNRLRHQEFDFGPKIDFDPFKGPRGPFKGPRGPFKGPRGPRAQGDS